MSHPTRATHARAHTSPVLVRQHYRCFYASHPAKFGGEFTELLRIAVEHEAMWGQMQEQWMQQHEELQRQLEELDETS